jgi:hypothetical protein
MRELQLDDTAISSLGVLDLIVVRQARERGSETVGTTRRIRIDRSFDRRPGIANRRSNS